MKDFSNTRFADPTVDFAFKRIFGTEQYKDATFEMQNARQEHFKERAVFYSSKMIVRQAPTGIWDFRTSTKSMMNEWDIENAKNLAAREGREEGRLISFTTSGADAA